MPRAVSAKNSRERRKKVVTEASGYFGNKSRLYRYAKEQVDRSGQYAYRHRRNKKREWRALWIIRLNAACRSLGITYSRFIQGLGLAQIEMDRRVLSDMAVNDPSAFAAVVEKARAALPAGTPKLGGLVA